MKVKYATWALVALFLFIVIDGVQARRTKGLKDVLGKSFLIGTAMNGSQIWERDTASLRIICQHFNTVVAENCMKAEPIHPEEHRYYWDEADRFVDFAQKHHLTVTGHCLVWHSQAPQWMFKNEDGNDVSRDVLIDRMRRHIYDVVGRYKGRVKGWDVINEAFNDDGTYRETPFLRIIGPDYFFLAFQFAHEADPDAELYYNDYSMALPRKRDAVCRLVRQMKARGLRIDAVGMQSHVGLVYPDLRDYEATIDSIVATGAKVMVTELDVNVLPNPWDFSGADINQRFQSNERMNPFANGLDDTTMRQLEMRYLELFRLYKKHRKDILRVTLWGVTDRDSWLNNFPIAGRTNYPLPFDRQNRPKPFVPKLMELFRK